MTSARIAAALAHSSETRVVELGRGAVTQTGSRFLQLFGRRPAVILADGNHWQAAGAPVLASLAEAGIRDVRMHLFPATPTLYASYERVEEVREFLAPLEAVPIAIASGSLNDIVKLACGELGREYMCVATAASMDGYIAFGASVTRDGFKSQFTCPAPAGLIADVDIMAAAPPRLTATGFADLIEKIPAGADWILADELGVEPLDMDVFGLMQGAMPRALADPDGCRLGAPEAIEGLGEGLVLSGLAMQAYRTSRPASGGGHHFSHTWEMEGYGLDWEPPLSHGFKVGLGTIAVSALFERVLSKDLSSLVDIDGAVAAWPSWQETEAKVRRVVREDLQDRALTQTKAKYVGSAELRVRLERLVENWPRIHRRLREQLLSTAELQAKLDAVGAVSHPSQIMMPMDRLRATYDRARWIRSRYVLSDMLTEANLFDALVDELFAPGGYWAERRPLPPAL